MVRSLDGTLIGSSSYLNVDAPNRRLEIGATWYVSSARRSGVNSETKLLMLGHAFDELRLCGSRIPHTLLQLHQQGGYRATGRKTRRRAAQPPVLPDGSRRDTVVYSILDIEWPAVRNNLRYRLEPQRKMTGSQRRTCGQPSP